jgi:hypothetical protein
MDFGSSVKEAPMLAGGLHCRFFKSCALAAFVAVLVACGGGNEPPPPGQPVSLSITGMPTASMLPGESAQLAATLTYSDASTKDVTSTAIWSTTNVAVLSLSSAGRIVAVAPGQADVIASAQGLSSRVGVRVERPVPRLALFAGSLGGAGYVDGAGAIARFSSPTGSRRVAGTRHRPPAVR